MELGGVKPSVQQPTIKVGFIKPNASALEIVIKATVIENITNEVQQKIQSIIQSLDDVVKICKGTAAQVCWQNMSVRIFNVGEDVNIKRIRKYSPEYAKMRKEAGLQTTYVDLTFTTDLRNSIIQNENRVEFKNQYAYRYSQ